ncbi:MAG: metallophosphoesterase [Candidatus Nanohaloarchaea archaeon]
MNEKAVKQLTQKGCIVEKDAAEKITEQDLERIEALDSPPMYITEPMLSRLREDHEKLQEQMTEVESGDQKLMVKKDREQVPGEIEAAVDDSNVGDTEEEDATGETDAAADTGVDEGEGSPAQDPNPGDVDQDVQRPASTMRDTGSRDLRTKVEVLDQADISKEDKDVPEFLQYYNDRYDRMKKILMQRMEMKSAVSIQRLDRRDEGEEAATVGLVKDKYSTRSGKYIIELEDKTGTFKALIDERDGDRIVPDEVIGVRGSMGEDIIFANSVVRPDLPIPDGVNTTSEKVKAAYISDFHVGSKDTMYDRMDKFARWLNSDEAKKVGYLVIPGDIVEGVGTYPGQEEELEITDIYRQYARFEEWAEKLPDDLEIIIGPGNHDVVRLAEPQPALPEKALPNMSQWENVHLVQNPQYVRLHGIRSKGIMNLIYHGYSFDDHVDQIQELREKAYDDPHHVMIDLLKRRHLAPTYGSNLLSPEEEDHLVIVRKPDILASGHFHSHANESYKGVNVICASTFQQQTDFQKRVGHEPQPGLVTFVDYKTRNTEVKKF